MTKIKIILIIITVKVIYSFKSLAILKNLKAKSISMPILIILFVNKN